MAASPDAFPLERHLRLFAECSPEHAIIFLDPEGIVTWWSPGAAKVFGHTAGQIVGQSGAKLFTAEDAARGIPDYELRVAAANGVAEDDRWQLRVDGSRFYASGAMVALREDGKLVGFGKVLRNRTDLKEQLETLRNAVTECSGALKRRETFVATLAHELRNPLAPIANATEILRQSGQLPQEAEYALRVIGRQMDLIRHLVDDLFEQSRANVGKLLVHRQPLDLREALRHVLEAVRPLLVDQMGHDVKLILPEGAIIVQADPARLSQVFVNLLTNAGKYTPRGGRILVKGTVEPGQAVVRIEDNGVGIPTDMLPRIFEAFVQVDGKNEASRTGLGIGLAVVKQIVDLHGGQVQVRSDGPGRGSEFTVRLPLEPDVVP